MIGAEVEIENPLVDLGDLCEGLLNSGIPSFAEDELQEMHAKQVPATSEPKSPPEVSVASALPLHVRVPPSECSPALAEEDDTDDIPCWGGMLKGSSASCTPTFTAGKQHFKNKFCEACRKGIAVPASRVRAVYPAAPQALVANSLRAGFWKRSAAALGGVEVRIANNTITCDGPWLVVYREPPPPTSASMPWQTIMPEGWVGEDDIVHFSVAKGTLVPMAELTPGKRPTVPANEHLVGFNQGPKRQRRAPTLADIPDSELPPGGLPPSVRRGYSTASAATSKGSRASSLEGSPPSGPLAADSLPPMIGKHALPPPVTVPPSPNAAAVPKRPTGHGAISPSQPVQQPVKAVPVPAAAAASTPAAAAVAHPPHPLAPPSSPAELSARLAASYGQAALLLEQSLKPLSPLRTQLGAAAVAELTAQLNATRAAMETCARLASPESFQA